MPLQLDQEAPSAPSLLADIAHDAQELMRQQLTLFQVEIKNDVRRTVHATLPIIAGAIICLIAGLAVAITAAEWGVWMWPQLPRWGAFAIVTAIFVATGGACIFVGKLRFQSFNPLPEQS